METCADRGHHSYTKIQEELLNAGCRFLRTSRFTQDYLENFFSMIRLKNPIPSPLSFKYVLKIINISQFTSTSYIWYVVATQSSYQEDDRDFAVDFLGQPVPLLKCEREVKGVELSEAKALENLNESELNSLYCVYGIKKNESLCPKCIGEIVSASPGSHYAAALTDLKEYKAGCLVHVGDMVFSIMLEVEIMFRNISDSIVITASNLNKLLLDKAEELKNCPISQMS